MTKKLLPAKNTPIEYKEWRTENSLLNFISNHVDPNGRLTDSAHDLPDVEKDPEMLSFAPGLLDAMTGTHTSAKSKAVISKLVKLLKHIAEYGDQTSEYTFYKLITEQENIIGIVDDFQEAFIEKSLPVEPYLHSFAKDLITKTAHRNSVKMGIAIVGLYKDQSIVPAIKILALHDEFTLYATIALLNILDTPAPALWELAQKVDGWGKIQLVNRLINLELTTEIQEWLVYEGYKNSIMYEYLAYTCATNGRLHEKLDAAQIDKRLFKAAGEIIYALINGGPAEDISMYEEAPNVIENYIRHAHEHTSDVLDFLQFDKLKSFLTGLTEDIGEHEKNGWTQDIVSNCLIDLLSVLNNREWEQITREALTSNDESTYWQAKSAASILGIDIWDIVWQRLQQHPLNSEYWYDVAIHAPKEKVTGVIDFALTHLPLQEYTTGPKDRSDFGENFSKYQCLNNILVFLKDYPQKGEPIVLAALDSPVTENRNMAIDVLTNWTQQQWSPQIQEKVKKLAEIEPNKDTRKDIKALLK
ncbi:hypothetical protein L3C95_30255 [Chitinophaga filiformis]|uniref:hypothetical protein n=1 Tax=Chitinophaga filiformis TaxID=104663 RepID=UPI001F458D23|nr:hypothetical protein [Chitinophaga filiformis]MCF6407218.1 hypothetical protein [Chitinophaga filiformis]